MHHLPSITGPQAARLGLAAVGLALATVAAHADTTTYFWGQGRVSLLAPPNANGDMSVAVRPPSEYAFGGTSGWQMESAFAYNRFSGVGAGTFTFGNGFDSLSGSIAVQGNANLTEFTADYSVLSGSGAWLGALGVGHSTVSVNAPSTDFIDNGSFTLAPVPEPGTWALMLAGGAWLGWRRRLAA